MNSSFSTVAPLRHGLISCAACFPPGHEPGVTYEADGWRVDNNPGYWGAASPEVLVLGFSKGANQRGGMPFDRIAFNNARGNLKEILTTLGLVDAGADIDACFTSAETRIGFASVVRCGLGMQVGAGKYTTSGKVVRSAIAHGSPVRIFFEVRKYGVAVVLAHQWLEQAAVESDNMLAAIRNATNLKVVFRLKDHKEAEDLAHMVVPLDLEMPVETLRRPTVVGHRRTWLANESTGTNRSRTTTQGLSLGDTEALGETVGTSYGVTRSEALSDGWSIGETESEGSTAGFSFGENATQGSSLTATSSVGASVSMGIVTMPTDQTLLPPPYPTVLSESYGVGFNTSESLGVGASSSRGISSARSEAKSRSTGRSSALTSSQSRAVAQSSSVSHAQSAIRARSTARSISEGESLGDSDSRGLSEALEPILEDRPGSVHGKDNVLYMAAQTLRSLPTGHALLNYVGPKGMVATRLVVPLVKSVSISNDTFVRLRECLLSESAATIPSTLAQGLVDARENAFLKFTKQHREEASEPATFRVRARADAPCRGGSSRVAGRRALSGEEMLNALLDHAAPLTDGCQEQAEPALGQGSRSPEATARRAALDGTQVRPKKAHHAVKGKTRDSSKV